MIAFVDLVPVATEKVSLYPVEYCLESVEEYSEGTIHKSKPEPRNGDVNTVYFINQARGNTRINRTEFTYDANSYLYLSFLLRIMFVKVYFYKLSFAPKHHKLM